jgi:orotate phosphoribosyltransferase
VSSAQVDALLATLASVVREKGVLRFEEPIVLASGRKSREFVDMKAALADGEDLELACRAVVLRAEGLAYDVVGGPTMGADPIAHVVAVLTRTRWAVVRKEPKDRGTAKLVEGAAVGPSTRVLLVEDVVTTGGSLLRACEVLRGLGAEVVGAVPIVDRGELAATRFAELAVPYRPVLTWRDLGIEPIGDA